MLPLPALADTGTIPGPITARVVSVYDGDTLTVDAEPWAGRYFPQGRPRGLVVMSSYSVCFFRAKAL